MARIVLNFSGVKSADFSTKLMSDIQCVLGRGHIMSIAERLGIDDRQVSIIDMDAADIDLPIDEFIKRCATVGPEDDILAWVLLPEQKRPFSSAYKNIVRQSPWKVAMRCVHQPSNMEYLCKLE